MHKQKPKSKHLLDRFNRLLGSSQSLMIGAMSVELLGGRMATVEGVKYIVEFDDTLVRLWDKKHEVRILGSELTLRYMNEHSVEVQGKISMIEYDEGRRSQ